MDRNIIRCQDADELANRAVQQIITRQQEAIAARDRFTLVLTGGSTPEKTYRLLAQPEHATAIDWTKTIIFEGDERFVPWDDARSNYGMARRSLLDTVAIPDGRVFPIPTDTENPEEAATAYEATLRAFFAGESRPRFDLILLGLGDDGHIASLFPHYPSLAVTDRWAVASPPGTLPPPVDRITLTYPALNAGRHILFLVAGANKAEAVRDVLEGGATKENRPAVGIQPTDGTVTWLLDEAAASLLTT